MRRAYRTPRRVGTAVLQQVGRPISGIGFIVVVDRRRVAEPLDCILGAAGCGERVRVGVPQPCAAGFGMLEVKATTFEDRECGVDLTEVAAGAGYHDEQLHPGSRVELADGRIVHGLQGTLRTTESTLAVRHHSNVRRIPGDPPGRAQLRQRLCPFLGMVGGKTAGLANRRDAGPAASCGPGMVEGLSGIIVDGAASRDEMRANELSRQLAERTKLGAHRRIQ
jgi:hypothetical protein